VPFKSLGVVSYSPSIVTMAVSVAVYDIFSVKEWPDLENRVIGFVQGYRKWHQLIDRMYELKYVSCLHTRSIYRHKYYTNMTFKSRLRVTQGH